jgi:hypothetical protein
MHLQHGVVGGLGKYNKQPKSKLFITLGLMHLQHGKRGGRQI